MRRVLHCVSHFQPCRCVGRQSFVMQDGIPKKIITPSKNRFVHFVSHRPAGVQGVRVSKCRIEYPKKKIAPPLKKQVLEGVRFSCCSSFPALQVCRASIFFCRKRPLIVGLFCEKQKFLMQDRISVCVCVCVYRVAKIRRMYYLNRSFSAKEPYNQWLFCGKNC